MADLRLVGARLGIVRRLTGNPFTRSVLWSVTSKDFRIPELAALPAAHRHPLDDSPRPVQGAEPRHWGAETLDLPSSPRCTGRMLREAFATQQTTPSAVLERVIGRLDRGDFGPATHSPFVALDPEGARAAAAESDRRWKEGSPLGPLDGVIVPVKDEFHARGLPTRGGTVYKDQPEPRDAWLVARLRAAGAIVLGKTHATEWGLNPCGYNEHFDMPRNVYSCEHGAGGSSTGSGAAVGLGLATVAVGTDGGGSIRIPAVLNGVFGLKPTYIRIGRTGDIWGSGTMPHIGPIGQSTEDLVDFMEVAAGIDPNDPTTRFAPDYPDVLTTWRRALGRGIRGCRIGVLHQEMADADPAIAKVIAEALQAFERDGAVLRDVEIPLAYMAPAIGAITIGSETAANTSDDVDAYASRMTDEFRTIVAMMSQVSAGELLGAARARAALRRQTARVMAELDLLALPATARPAPAYALSEGRVPLMDSGATAAMTRFAFLGNLTGLPASTMPLGLHGGLTVGLQLMGDAWDEASVIAGTAHAERMGLTDVAPSPGWRSLLA